MVTDFNSFKFGYHLLPISNGWLVESSCKTSLSYFLTNCQNKKSDHTWYPQLTMPIMSSNSCFTFFASTWSIRYRGPPLSPWQASVPFLNWTQILFLSSLLAYLLTFLFFDSAKRPWQIFHGMVTPSTCCKYLVKFHFWSYWKNPWYYDIVDLFLF